MKRPSPLFLLHIRECFCVHAVFFPTLPFIGMTVLIPGLPVVIRYAADYGQTRKEKFQTWAGLQWSSSGASALPKQPPSSVLQFLPFYRLSRQSVANPFPPVTCGRGDTVLQAKPYGLFYFPYCPFPCFLPPLMCFFHSSI